MRNVLLVLTLLGCWGAWQHYRTRPIPHSPGTVVATAPSQTSARDDATFPYKGHTLTRLQDFDIRARVLSRADYSLDRGATLAPVDLALGWGRMSDSAVLAAFEIWQTNRYFFWKAERLPIPQDEIISSSSNMHLIPADAEVARRLRETRVGDIVHFSGSLVEARGSDGHVWRSSLSRTDSGDGACELVYVEQFIIQR